MMRVAGTQCSNYDIVEHILYTRRLATHSDWLRVRRRCSADDGTISYNRHLGEFLFKLAAGHCLKFPGAGTALCHQAAPRRRAFKVQRWIPARASRIFKGLKYLEGGR